MTRWTSCCGQVAACRTIRLNPSGRRCQTNAGRSTPSRDVESGIERREVVFDPSGGNEGGQGLRSLSAGDAPLGQGHVPPVDHVGAFPRSTSFHDTKILE